MPAADLAGRAGGLSALAGWAGPELRRAGGPVLLGVLGLVILTGFWWFMIWFLRPDGSPAGSYSPPPWRSRFWLGMEVAFSVIFSGMVTSYDMKYGPIGVSSS